MPTDRERLRDLAVFHEDKAALHKQIADAHRISLTALEETESATIDLEAIGGMDGIIDITEEPPKKRPHRKKTANKTPAGVIAIGGSKKSGKNGEMVNAAIDLLVKEDSMPHKKFTARLVAKGFAHQGMGSLVRYNFITIDAEDVVTLGPRGRQELEKLTASNN